MSERNGNGDGLENGKPLDPDLARGLVYIHEKLGTRILGHQELTAHVYALTETLIANGVISLRDFEARKQRATQQMMDEARARWEGAQVLDDESDKYQVEGVKVDCHNRLHLCKAACCRLHFHLSKQDLHEGVVRWDVTKPYQIAQRDDGWCTHCDKQTKRCNVHAERPIVCRRYDCRNDPRIWENFDEGIPNPDLAHLY